MFIISLVLRLCEDEEVASRNQHLLMKLNSTLVSIVKQEWTTSWQNFIPDICSNAKESQSKCENTLVVLKLLSEEVFDFSKNALLAAQAKQLKEIMTNDFATIFELCVWVLQTATTQAQTIKPSLVRACLKTFQAFMSWIPLAYIFETNLVEMIINNFLAPSTSRNEAIRCFTEIASLSLDDSDEAEKRACKEKTCLFFCYFVAKIAEITKNRSLLEEFQSLQGSKHQTSFETFAKQLALSIAAVLRNNLDMIEEMTNAMEPNQNIQFLQQCVQKALEYLVQLSQVPEDELFKICLDFWNFFSENVMVKVKGH